MAQVSCATRTGPERPPEREEGDLTVPKIDIPDGKGDPEVRVWALRPEMGMAAGAMSHAIYEQSILPVRERELARMRIAQINDCAICRQWRKTTGAAEAMTEADYAAVEQWATHPGYTERERLAIEYADKFALDHHALDDAFFARHARGVHRCRDPRPHSVRRRLARHGPHPARARHRRVLPHPWVISREIPRSRAATAATPRRCRATGRSGARTAATSRRARCAPPARTRASTGPRRSSATTSVSPTSTPSTSR